jgi:hypothetical protein
MQAENNIDSAFDTRMTQQTNIIGPEDPADAGICIGCE